MLAEFGSLRRRALMNQLLTWRPQPIHRSAVSIKRNAETHLVYIQASLLHQQLLFIFSRVRMVQVIVEPTAKQVRDVFGQVPASPLSRPAVVKVVDGHF